MMMELNLHGEPRVLDSVQALEQALQEARALAQCELWLTRATEAEQGPALCMLRNGGNAWLMYLSGQDDLSFHTLGDEEAEGTCSYLLSNGQVDEYPEAWCVEVEHCQRAFVAFFRTGGARPAAIAWEAD
ncbi:Imm1 family immunity protein [Janthinobacterium sp. 75]|uniref:Imm1 family immunity protein n=1 Tax=Janthinobacterium sp. 75 TaxID=2135628 RepID=UPI001063DD40|nr:Imm1 family immunity protein [Janthinobacterium sp. 75]TDY34989.1 immunity protein Imm1 of predicted polymorphic toxin system [Janthinobacterium sp. 75]